MKTQVKNFGQFLNEGSRFDKEIDIEMVLGIGAAEMAEYLMIIAETAPDCIIMDIQTENNNNPNEPAFFTLHGPADQIEALERETAEHYKYDDPSDMEEIFRSRESRY
jgi:hypothetical protein